MKKVIFPIILIAILLQFFPSGLSAQGTDFFNKLKGNLLGNKNSTALTEDRIIQGLKEALKVGTGNAINNLSNKGSFLNNPEIKITLPSQIKKIEKVASKAGLGFYFDTLEESMNTAAEQATPMAKQIVFNALKNMNFQDAKKILGGRDNEATLYFREKSFSELMNIFKPAVHTAMSKTGVTKNYQDLENRVKNIPFIGAVPKNYDLDAYVSENALNGIFHMIEKEEQKIRKDPAARITELLKDVFGRK
jgi:hypothetical protein